MKLNSKKSGHYQEICKMAASFPKKFLLGVNPIFQYGIDYYHTRVERNKNLEKRSFLIDLEIQIINSFDYLQVKSWSFMPMDFLEKNYLLPSIFCKSNYIYFFVSVSLLKGLKDKKYIVLSQVMEIWGNERKKSRKFRP